MYDELWSEDKQVSRNLQCKNEFTDASITSLYDALRVNISMLLWIRVRTASQERKGQQKCLQQMPLHDSH